MKKTILWLVIFAGLLVSGFWLFNYFNKVEMPIVGKGGEVKGNYSIESIMALKKPYRCSFEKNDGVSLIVGTMTTDSQKIYGEFRIKTELVEKEFNSFLIIRDGESYTWTSLGNVGYKFRVAKSSSKNASPEEQAQIVGTQDKMEYKCEALSKIDQSMFGIPSGIAFPKLDK